MKLKVTLLSAILSLSVSTAHADDIVPYTGNGLQQMNTSLINLGKYLGDWNLQSPPPETSNTNYSNLIASWPWLLAAVTKAPIATVAQLPLPLTIKKSMSLWTDTIGTTYYGYDNPSFFNTVTKWLGSPPQKIQANPVFDQQAYQTLPTLQVIQNILSTPTSEGEPNSADDISNLNCGANDPTCLIDTVVLLEKAGGILHDKVKELKGSDTVSYNDIFGSDISALVSPSLSFDSLIGPINYSTKAISPSTSSSSFANELEYDGGLYGSSELTRADTFIRYVSGNIVPPTKDEKLNKAISRLSKGGFKKRYKNAAAINEYILTLRSFAAQASVGMSNFYALMAKRATITDESGKAVQGMDINGNTHDLSQASQELRMALRRFVPQTRVKGSKDANTWAQMIMTAPPAQVQRETALLLAEINYQMYLNRQMQERMLATMSAMQLQLLSTARDAVKFKAPQ